MYDLKKLQEEIFQNKVNHGFNTTDMSMEFCLTYAELGEAYTAWIRRYDNLGEELADVAIFLLGIAEMNKIDLGKEIINKIEKNKNRKYKTVNGALVKEGE